MKKPPRQTLFQLSCTVVLAVSFFLNSSIGVAKQHSKEASELFDELKLKAGDEANNEFKSLKAELLVQASEKQALEQAQRLLKKYKGTRMEAEVLYRLASLYMRRARSERFFEVHRDSQQVLRVAPDLVNTASEKAQIRLAVATYRELEQKFPHFRSRDVVVFNTAYAYQQLGEEAQAELFLKRLLADYGNSYLIPDTLLALGEIYFTRRQFTVAMATYLKLREHSQSRAFPYGLYKAAWCQYNLQNIKQSDLNGENPAMKLLEEVIAYNGLASGSEKLISSRKLDLRSEALNDLALFYSDTRPAKDAVAYFKEQARSLDPSIPILRLVEIYKRHSKYEDVDTVLSQALEQFKSRLSGKQVASLYNELIWNAERVKKRDNSVAYLEQLAQACSATVKESEDATECHSRLSEDARKLGAKLHAQWKKDKQPSIAHDALIAYEIYLRDPKIARAEPESSKDPKRFAENWAQVRYAASDLHFALGDFTAAAEGMERVETEADSLLKDSRSAEAFFQINPQLTMNSIYGASLALEKSVAQNKWSNANAIRFGTLVTRYLQHQPRGEYAYDLKFKQAFIEYENGNLGPAREHLHQLTQMPGPADRVMKAQDLYLDVLNQQKNYSALKTAALQFAEKIQSEPINEANLKRSNHFLGLRQQAWFSELNELEAKTEPGKMAELYYAFSGDAKNVGISASSNSTIPLVSLAWWNATQLEFKAGKALEAAQHCVEFVKKFKEVERDPKGKACLFQAAQTYESSVRLSEAGASLELLARLDSPNSAKWLDRAREYRALSSNNADKIVAFDSGLDRLVQNKDLDLQKQIGAQLLALDQELGESPRSQKLREKLETLNLEPALSELQLRPIEKLAARYFKFPFNAGTASTSASALEDFDFLFKQTKKLVGKDSKAPAVAARARWIQALILTQEFRNQSIKAKVERLGVVLAIKTEKLEKAQQALLSTIKLAKDAEPALAVHAQWLLGDIYLDYSHAVSAIRLPAETNENDSKVFKAEIERLSVPMEEKGIDALQAALKRSAQLKLYDGSQGVIQRRLDEANFKVSPPPIFGVEPQVQPLKPLLPRFQSALFGWNGVGK